MTQPVETANPQQYLRLLLMRLLETQAAIRPVAHMPQLAALRRQYQENEYILSEIKSWLERQPKETESPLGPSGSTVSDVVVSGPESSQPSSEMKPTDSGSSQSPFAWRTPRQMDSRGTSQVQSSLPSGLILPDSAKISNGGITFLPPSLNGKLDSIWDGDLEEED